MLNRQPTRQPTDFNFFKIQGSNEYGTLGIGQDDNNVANINENQVYNLREFTNKKVYSMAVGEHHIIVTASEANFEDLPG